MKNSSRHSQQRGAALVIGLILLAIITLLAVVGMNISNSELASATSEQLRLRAFQSAETGIEHGLLEIYKLGTDNKGVPETGVVTAVAGSSVNASNNAKIDTYQNKLTYLECGQIADTYSTSMLTFHFSVESTGTSGRNAVSQHTQGAYIPYPGAAGETCPAP